MEPYVDGIVGFISALNTLSPLGVIGLLAIVLYQMSKNQKVVTGNHLHGLPIMEQELKNVSETLQRIEVLMSTEFSYIRARLNGKGGQ